MHFSINFVNLKFFTIFSCHPSLLRYVYQPLTWFDHNSPCEGAEPEEEAVNSSVLNMWFLRSERAMNHLWTQAQTY